MEATANRTDLVSTYFKIWNEKDNSSRLAKIQELWEEDGSYTDPLHAVRGHSQISELMGGFHQKYPGFTFVGTGEVDAHHNFARFTWDLVTLSGDIVAKGTDIALFSDDDRIIGLGGFFDQAPALG